MAQAIVRQRSHASIARQRSAVIDAAPTNDDSVFEAARLLRAVHPADHEQNASTELPEVEPMVIQPVEPRWDGPQTVLPSFEQSQALEGSMSRSISGLSQASSTASTVTTHPARLSSSSPASSQPSSPNMSQSTSRRSMLINLLRPNRSNHSRTESASAAGEGVGLGIGSLGPSVQRSASLSVPGRIGANSSAMSSSASMPLISSPNILQEPAKPSLEDIGVSLSAITPSMAVSRIGQPLCGAILDGKYLLIGGTTGLDFLPLGLKDRKRPISLIKRTRFRQLVILAERSNVLLAVAGRNDHVRVYALDGVRSIIERRMRDVFGNARPPPARTEAHPKAASPTRTRKAAPPVPPLPASVAPASQEPISPPPAYLSPRRQRPPSLHSIGRPPSTVSTIGPPTPGARPRPVHSPGAMRRAKSRESMRYSVPRRPSLATMPRSGPSAEADGDWLPDDEDDVPPLPTRSPISPRIPRSPSVESDHAAIQNLKAFLSDGPAEPALKVPRSSPRRSPRAQMIARQPSGQEMSARALTDFLREDAPIQTKLKTGMSDPPATDEISPPASSDDSPPLPPLPPSPRSPRPRVMPRSPSVGSGSSRELAAFLRDERPPSIPRTSSSTLKGDPVTARDQSTADQPRPSNELYAARRVPASAPTTPKQANTRFGDAPPLPSSPTSRLPSGAPKPAPRSAVRERDDSTRDLANFLADGPPVPSKLRSSTGSVIQRLRTDGSERPMSSGSLLSTNSQERSASRASTMTWATVSEDANNSAQHSDTPLLGDEARSAAATATEEEVAVKKSRRRTVIDAIKNHVPHPFESHATEPVASTSVQPEASSSRRVEPEPAPVLPQSPEPSRQPAVVSPVMEKRPTDPAAAHALDDHSAGAVLQAVAAQNGLNVNTTTTQITAEGHPANAQAPLEYVKLARTKGARMIRASETKRKTYLAVLCGDAGERVELFTGSRNVSLSLNRTFVLPSVPRTLEFQLQGDELVDIYLIYDESIFALEPATVRVREVGVARHERRAARRQREVERQQGRTSADAPERPSTPSGSRGSNTPNRHPQQAAIDERLARTATQIDARPEDGAPFSGLQPRTDATAEANGSSEQPKTAPEIAFSTFQQLHEIPPVPSSVLASAFVIPPTYDAVVSSTPASMQQAFPGAEDAGPPSPSPERAASAFQTPDPNQSGQSDIPLLSPISLLANHPARNSGPPGLFFVSRGRYMTNIVDAEGRSVIQRPIRWDVGEPLPDLTPDTYRAIDIFSRIEMLIVEGQKTVLLGIGSTQIQAVDLSRRSEGDSDGLATQFHPSVEVISNEARQRKAKTPDGLVNLRDIVYLGKVGPTAYYSERVGNNVVVHSVRATA